MGEPAIDTRALSDRFMSSGMDDHQAQAIADAIMDSRQGLAKQADLADVKSDVAEVKSDVANVKSDLAEVKSDLADVKTRMSSMEKRMDSLENRMAGMQVEIKDVRVDLKSLDTRMTNFETLVLGKFGLIELMINNQNDIWSANRQSERWMLGLFWVSTLAIMGAMIRYLN